MNVKCGLQIIVSSITLQAYIFFFITNVSINHEIKFYLAPCLLKLPPNADKYKDVHNQFVAAWKHPHKQTPQIYAIWKIFCKDVMNHNYNVYRAEVERVQQLEGKPFPKGDGRRTMSVGNEQRRFHGTKMYVPA